MKAPIRIIFNRRKTATPSDATSPKTAAVEIEININNKRKWIATGVRVYLDQWKDGMVVGTVDSVSLNTTIQKSYQKAVDAMNMAKTPAAISSVHLGKQSFCDWMEQRIEERRGRITDKTINDHLRTCDWLRQTGIFKSFADLTEPNIARWDMYLKKRLNKQSAIYGYHKRLKTYILIALRLGYIKDSPYRFFRVSRGRSDSVKYLQEEERKRVENIELPEGQISKARDMFIFACYTGLAYCDLVRVKDFIVRTGDSVIIDSSRLKTGTHYKLTLLPEALRILEKYNYDMNLMSNQRANLMLKVVQQMCGIKTKMSMHVGRHTFATWALNKGVPLAVVSKMLAHTNIATTQIYAKVLQQEVAAGFEKLRQCSGSI